ncbi:MAG: LapA family protein [Succinivibrio sp.]|nr:LapA family protein [Succinivibrio sp.]
MLKFWIYAIFLILLAVIGLAIGSANDSQVTFDFLLLKTDVTVAFVLVVGIIFGVLLGFYISLLVCFKYWRQAHSAKAALNRYLKEQKKENQASAENVVAEAN